MFVLKEKYILDTKEQYSHTHRQKFSNEVNGTVSLPLPFSASP